MSLTKLKKLELEKLHNEFRYKFALLKKKQGDILKQYSKALDQEKINQIKKTFSR